MASLNHVCMWSEHGWVKVTAEEAAAKHPGGTVSAHSGLFMCELCGQYVTLTDGYVRDRYFKHSAQESNKNCPERTFGPAYSPSYTPGEHDLPLKLVLPSSSNLRLELGLLRVPEKILGKQDNKQISITTKKGDKFTYSFERLNDDKITYVSVGDKPAEEYALSVSDELSAYWPKKVRGVSSKGSLFDAGNGKMLPIDADVRIDKKYNILTTRSYIVSSYQRANIQLALVCQQQVGWQIWRVYEVEAHNLNEIAAKFFLDIHYRLTDSPLEILPIWPMYIETPYVIKANQSEMIFHISGERQLTTKSFPHARIISNQCSGAGRGQVIKVDSNSRQQLISAGSANVLEYLYLWKEPLRDTYPPIEVTVKDEQGQIIPSGEYTVIPPNTRLSIEAPVDGMIILVRDDMIVGKEKLNAKERTFVQNLHFGMTIQVLQGLDIAWSATYLKPKIEKSEGDEALYLKLSSFKGKEIAIDHSIGGLARKLQKYPMVKNWLQMTVRKGHAPIDAINYLTRYMETLRYR